MNATEQLLRRLAENDQAALRKALLLERPGPATLTRQIRALVQLSALIAVDATTTSLRWAAEVASTAGVDDAAIIQVLLSSASETGAAQVVSAAPRMAMALDIDVEVEGWDGN